MPLMLALLLQAATPTIAEAALYRDCIAAAQEGAAGAIDAARRWLDADGGIPARHCLGLAYVAAGKPAEAAATFEAAARIAEATGAGEAGMLYGQAGNAALAAGEAARAEALMSAAIVAEPGAAAKGELMIDRAAAREAQGNIAGARADLDGGLRLAPDSAGGWLLRAALARREERLADARAAIERALALAPADPDVQLEAGNVAALDGDFDRARALWSAIVKTAPGSAAAKAADLALLRNPG
jgi:tetratricopeptide (TPR) repeat protein